MTDDSGQLVAQTAPTSRTRAGPSSTSQTANTASPGPLNEAVQPSIRDIPRGSFASTITTPTSAPQPIRPIVIQPPAPDPTPRALPASLPGQGTSFTSAAEALGNTLDLLSQRLVQTSLAANMDIRQIKDTAEAMETVMRALGTARHLAGNV